ncbi:hypothetical protein [Leptolyngbya sp. FACHB-16]|nr:hypothetical protein [Leptolyngbya sp. FACHB-16]
MEIRGLFVGTAIALIAFLVLAGVASAKNPPCEAKYPECAVEPR